MYGKIYLMYSYTLGFFLSKELVQVERTYTHTEEQCSKKEGIEFRENHKYIPSERYKTNISEE